MPNACIFFLSWSFRKMGVGKTFIFLFLFGPFLVSSSAEDSTSDAPPPPPPPHDWEKEIVTKVQEVYRPLNFPGW